MAHIYLGNGMRVENAVEVPPRFKRRAKKPTPEIAGAASSLAVSTGSVAREVEAAMVKLAAMPRPLVGIVCKPKLYVAVAAEAAKNAHPLFGAVPVFSKVDQPEDCLAFYDAEMLKAHLSPNAKISHAP